jgi:hypothetical protein
MNSKSALQVDVIRPATPSANDLQRKKISYFVLANLVAIAVGGGIFCLFLVLPEGTSFDSGMSSIWRFLRRHETVAVLAASLPFFASLLVGQFEMRKARARRTHKEAEDKRRERALELERQLADRAAGRRI